MTDHANPSATATPRTDATRMYFPEKVLPPDASSHADHGYFVSAQFARQLERELAEARSVIEESVRAQLRDDPPSVAAMSVVQKHRRHVELSPGAGEDVQKYALAVCDDILSDLQAARPTIAASAQDTVAWFIERIGVAAIRSGIEESWDVNGGRWFWAKDDELGWTNDPNLALRFSRKVDAEGLFPLICRLTAGFNLVATDHLWIEPATRSAREDMSK